MSPDENVLNAFENWYSGLKRYRGGFPANGTISGALVVTERLKTACDLDIDAHTAEGGSQIIGASGAAVARILSRFGENREFVSEGGRTNRGLRGDIKSLLDALRSSELDERPDSARIDILEQIQRSLVDKVKEFHSRQRLKITFNSSKSTRQLIRDILASAKETDKDGPVAQYLVGAKLQIRFPDITIGNESYSTADKQLNRVGDFLVGNTAFHVTVAPQPGVYLRCKRNLDDGYRVFLLVPDDVVFGARQNAETTAPGQIAVESIESFVAQNIEELAAFSRDELPQEVRQLLEMYNKRVDATEIDKSMMIQLPENLGPR